jgi:hypothetical protein
MPWQLRGLLVHRARRRPENRHTYSEVTLSGTAATGKRLIAEGRLPVPSTDELGTTQKLSSIEVSPGNIGAIEYRFEEVRTLQTQIRITECRSPKVGTAEIRAGKIEPGQIDRALRQR